MAHHVCGLYYLVPAPYGTSTRRYLPQVSLNVHSHIIGSTSRTALSQNFVNPDKDNPIPELRYTFPLYDGVSVVSFVCTINRTRVIKGVVQERAQARKTYQAAVDRGETAGLLEQLPNASDVFTTTIGNVPAGAEIKVDITYLGELKHDAESDGIRFTLPTSIAPRYGSYPGEVATSSVTNNSGGITIVIDAEVPLGSQIKNVQSPTHPIAVSIGNTAAGAASGAEMSLQKASATLSLGTTELGDDFVLHVVASNTSNPIAVLETHPTIPNQRALMATLVPKFNLPSSKPEVVFICDRSGSMQGTKVAHMVEALQVFLKSLPVGVKFNICSFGSHHTLLFPDGSRSYDAATLKEAAEHVSGFSANYGGTEMLTPLEDVFKRRYKDMDLEVFLLTDGEIWNQNDMFTMVNKYVGESKGAIRVFTLGIGRRASHSLIEGIARAGNGFSQAVSSSERMNSKVVRMLKASLFPHIKDYTLEVKYEKPETTSMDDDDFEIIEKVMDALDIDVKEPEVEPKADAKKPISLFDTSANPDVEMTDASLDTSAEGKYSHVPPVAEPKLLQSPFEIPPLFPFNRTSVYLLMSPGSTQRTPKSVILRGTSPSGPLELEIPVTVLPEKGETIHQLAARKAIKELEEGRGWLYHAREAASGPGQGQLLKDKFEGRFSDMVEREAVRLGVTYQVGGKWCSFVAVEENAEKGEQTEDVREAEAEAAMPQFGAPAGSSSASRARASGGGGGMKRFSQRVLARSSGRAPRSQLASNDCRKSATPSASGPDEAIVALPDEDGDCTEAEFASENATSVAPSLLVAFETALLDVTYGRAPAPQVDHQRAQLQAQQQQQQMQQQQQHSQQQSFRPMSHSRSRDCSDRRTTNAVASPQPFANGSCTAPSPAPPQAQSAAFAPAPAMFHNASAAFAPPPPPGGPMFPSPAMSAMLANTAATKESSQEPSRSGAKRASRASINTCAFESDGFSVESDGFSARPRARKATKASSQPVDRSSAFDWSLNRDQAKGCSPRDGGAPQTPEAVLELIVEGQAFDGAWRWGDGSLVSLLRLDAPQVAAKVKAVVVGASVVEDKVLLDVAATAVVLAYLEVKLAGKKDEWEMMAEKAVAWLEEAMVAAGVAGTVNAMVAEMKGLVVL